LIDKVRHRGRGQPDVQLLLAVYGGVTAVAAGHVTVVGRGRSRMLGAAAVALPEESVLLLLDFGRVAVYERRGRAHRRVHRGVGRHCGREHGLLRPGPVVYAVDPGAFTVQLGHLVLADGHVLNRQTRWY